MPAEKENKEKKSNRETLEELRQIVKDSGVKLTASEKFLLDSPLAGLAARLLDLLGIRLPGLDGAAERHGLRNASVSMRNASARNVSAQSIGADSIKKAAEALLSPEERLARGRENRISMYEMAAVNKHAELMERLARINRENPGAEPENDRRFAEKLGTVLEGERKNLRSPSPVLRGQPNRIADLLSDLNDGDLAAMRDTSRSMKPEELRDALRKRAYPDYYKNLPAQEKTAVRERQRTVGTPPPEKNAVRQL